MLHFVRNLNRNSILLYRQALGRQSLSRDFDNRQFPVEFWVGEMKTKDFQIGRLLAVIWREVTYCHAVENREVLCKWQPINELVRGALDSVDARLNILIGGIFEGGELVDLICERSKGVLLCLANLGKGLTKAVGIRSSDLFDRLLQDAGEEHLLLGRSDVSVVYQRMSGVFNLLDCRSQPLKKASD
ncbi:hypothetical protein ASG68_23660 [Rhizobium sp. Leaf453]|nr:hypothetical protein ASG68_23660 [Rhizobium sp. Leaf453]